MIKTALNLLRQFRNNENDDFTLCISDANTKTTILPLASAMQAPKR
jgi:hypothetical protein